MYQGHQAASTQVQDRRYGTRPPEAPTSMLSTTTDRQRRITLPPVPGSAKAAREFTAATLRNWHLDPLISDAVLIASELVTNAINHGSPPGQPGAQAGMGALAEPGAAVELTWSYQVSRL